MTTCTDADCFAGAGSGAVTEARLPPEHGRRQAADAELDEARASGRLWVIETGHDLMITEPEQVTDALVAVAAG